MSWSGTFWRTVYAAFQDWTNDLSIKETDTGIKEAKHPNTEIWQNSSKNVLVGSAGAHAGGQHGKIWRCAHVVCVCMCQLLKVWCSRSRSAYLLGASLTPASGAPKVNASMVAIHISARTCVFVHVRDRRERLINWRREKAGRKSSRLLSPC